MFCVYVDYCIMYDHYSTCPENILYTSKMYILVRVGSSLSSMDLN